MRGLRRGPCGTGATQRCALPAPAGRESARRYDRHRPAPAACRSNSGTPGSRMRGAILLAQHFFIGVGAAFRRAVGGHGEQGARLDIAAGQQTSPAPCGNCCRDDRAAQSVRRRRKSRRSPRAGRLQLGQMPVGSRAASSRPTGKAERRGAAAHARRRSARRRAPASASGVVHNFDAGRRCHAVI